MPDLASASDERSDAFVPALAYRWLTPLYDPVVRITTRERTFKARLIEQAGIAPGMRVLDVGCGTGTLAIAAKRAVPSAEIVGLDGDAQVLARASGKARDAHAEVVFDQGLSFDLPYADESFDRVLSSLLFHHLTGRDKRRTLAEIKRVLRPGGELHLADWGRPSGLGMRALSYVIVAFDGREQVSDNLSGNLPVMMQEAGFSSVDPGATFSTALGTLGLLAARTDPAAVSRKDD